VPAAVDLPQAHARLRELAADDDPVVACRALLALHASGGSDATLLRGFLDHGDEHLRAWGVRLLGDTWPLDGVLGPDNVAAEEAVRVAS
jgi:hypothetical protein